jgi:hypothetical protein
MIKNKLRTLLLTVGGLLITSASYAQSSTASPYSAFGIGDKAKSNSNYHNTLGGLGNGISNGNYLNTTNPASYSNLKLSTFEFGILGSFENYKQDQTSSGFSTVNLSQLSLGMNVGEKMGFAFALSPESSIGYDITQAKKDVVFPGTPKDTVGVVNSFKGDGGVSSIMIGGAYKIMPNLSVGANVKYYFGNLEQSTNQEFDNNAYLSSRLENTLYVKDLVFDFGAQYTHQLNETKSLTLGVVYQPEANLNTEQTDYHYTFKHNSTSESKVDTISFGTKDGSISLPGKIGFGLGYTIEDKLYLGADVNLYQWSGFTRNGISDDRYKNSTEIILGASYTPNKNDVRSFWKRSEYRLGMRYYTGHIAPNAPELSTTASEFGINFGIGLPIRKARGTLQIGFELGQRGTLENNLVKEQYFKTSLALTLRDRWFVRRKID